MTQNRKIVWVLGSGFSVPLGGPTLTSLLSSDSKAVVARIYPQNKYPRLYEDQYFTYSYKVFDYGLGNAPRNRTLPKMWADAEEYLDYLDTAVTFPQSPAAARVNSVINSTGLARTVEIPLLAVTTRRIIAAECSVFLEGTDTNLEKWRPYYRWAKMLDYNHTIITFNYDRVLEIVSEIPNIKNIHFGRDSFRGLNYPINGLRYSVKITRQR
jgi:hypothetical protein